MLSSK